MMKKLLLFIGCLVSVSLAAQTPIIEAHVCKADYFLAGCTPFPRGEGDRQESVEIGGTYYDLHLTWGETAEFSYEDSVAVGGTYLFGCKAVTLDGKTDSTFRDTLMNSTRCDSIVTLKLKAYKPIVLDTLIKDVKDSLCYMEEFVSRKQKVYPRIDTTFSDTISHADTLITDSTIVIYDLIYNYALKVWPKVVVKDTLCDTVLVDSLPYKWKVYKDHVISCDTAGIYRDTVYNSLPQHCDSIIYSLSLKVIGHDTIEVIVPDSNLCDGDVYKSRWQELTMVGREAIFDTTFNDTVIVPIVEPFTEDTIHDTIYMYHLYVWPKVVVMPTKYDTALVDTLPYHWHTYTGKTIECYTADTYRDTAKNILNCDSVHYTLELKVIEHDTIEVIVPDSNLCDGDVYKSRWQELTMVGLEDNVFDTTFNDTVKSQMVEPLQMNDTIYKYHLYIWPKTKYPEALKDTIDNDKWPYIWNVYAKSVGDTVKETITEGGQHFHHRKNILDCDSIVYELQLAVRTVETRYATPVDTNVCKGTEYQGRLTKHTINGLTEWQDSLRIWDNDLLLAIDSIYTYSIDTLPTRIPDDEISQIKAFCDYPVDYSYAWLNVAEFVNPSFIFAQITDTIWEVETHVGWQPAATTILTSDDEQVRVRVTVVTECGTTVSTSQPYEVKMATADDKEELTIPASQKYGSRIIMIDKNATETLGWTIPEADVTWYQVVGDRDDHGYYSDPADWDDKKVHEGQYYFTLTDGAPLQGQYYAIVTGATKGEKMTRGVELRTPVLVCNEAKAVGPVLSPTYVTPGGQMKLTNLTQGETQLNVFSPAGQLIRTENVKNETEYELHAENASGFYLLQVLNNGQKYVFKYVVTR